jgi:hypothetical protein
MKLLNQFFSSLVAAMLFALPLTASDIAPYKVLNPGQEVIEKPQTVVHGAGHRTTHNGSNHVYVGTTLLGDQIEIEDGSHWMVKPDDRQKLHKFEPGHSIQVFQNTSWFGTPSFPYLIYNEITYQTLQVENTAPPDWDSYFTRYIIEINKPAYGEGILKLNDGSVWILPDTQRDRDCWTLWLPNHTVIIGSNVSVWSGYFNPDILINITCSDQYVPSKSVN